MSALHDSTDLLEQLNRNLASVTSLVADDPNKVGQMVKDLGLPDGSLAIAILRHGTGFVPLSDSVIEAGDEVLIVLDTGLETKITERFQPPAEAA